MGKKMRGETGVSPRYSGQAPEMLLDLVEKTVLLLISKGGMDKARASEIGITLAENMARAWGGSLTYFPKGNWNGRSLSCFQLSERDWKIYSEYNGTNRVEVCTRYQVSERRLYQIISTIREQRKNLP